MYKIHKITSCHTVDYAAEELKKYLRMMMPECGDITIDYSPYATDGFRIGLMHDFGLDTSDVANVELDDLLYADCHTDGGIIAGGNSRSVLLSVYEYLRRNGCRWLMPGVDGEYIPMRDITDVKYRHAASCRYRGTCIEGAQSQDTLLAIIDFLPKVGMNTFMMQFINPRTFYERYYDHLGGITRSPEPVSSATVMQWKRQCESEISKRGLQYHDIGHGWTAEPFGLSTEHGWAVTDDSEIPDGIRKYFAMLNGKRTLFCGKALNTNFCMSNEEARLRVAEYIANYSENHSNVDYLHVWLADGSNNHCECDECRKKTPSDWYIKLLNDIDDALTRKNLTTRVVFIAYVDTTWAPVIERINNPERFTLMIAPITRSYTSSFDENNLPKTLPYVRNKLKMPKRLDEYIAYFDEWKKVWQGANLCFEYHFWRHQLYSVSGIALAKRIFEDVEAYSRKGINGQIACGSQRSFFPNGFAHYVFARKQLDISLSYEELLEDYYSTAYGEDWKRFYDYLLGLEEILTFAYMSGEDSENNLASPHYSPTNARKIEGIFDAVENGKELIKEHYNSERRLSTVSVRLLEYHGEYLKRLASCFIPKALGNDDESMQKHAELAKYLSEIEAYTEHYFDTHLASWQIKNSLKVKTNIEQIASE